MSPLGGVKAYDTAAPGTYEAGNPSGIPLLRAPGLTHAALTTSRIFICHSVFWGRKVCWDADPGSVRLGMAVVCSVKTVAEIGPCDIGTLSY
jgi:hypothetical protein